MMTNFRATALGAMIGFVIAVASSCGGAACNTCVDSAGKCVAAPANGTDPTCGTKGAACVNCKTKYGANSTCQATFLCSGAPVSGDGGTGGGSAGGNGGGSTVTGGGTGTTGGGSAVTGGGTGTTGGGTGSTICPGGTTPCAGCCSGSTCVPTATSTMSKTNCGLGGIACVSCPGSQVCGAGVCGTPGNPDAGNSIVGKTCATNADCSGLLNGICKLTTTIPAAQNGTYPGGYCTLLCDATNTCPTGSQCVGFGPARGEPAAFCTKNCRPPQTPNSPDCRTGYGCYGLTNAGAQLPDGACWLNPSPVLDAGTPADKVGQACANDTACATAGNTNTFCFTSTLPDGGPSGFQDGYCSAGCNDDSNCSANGSASCITLGTAPNQFDTCLQNCPRSEVDGGQNSCRTGYTCQDVNATLAVCF